MEHLSNDHKDHSSQRENIHKLCDETGQPILSLLESQWKLRQQRQNFPMKGRPLENKYWHQNKEINPKEQDCESHIRDPNRKANHLSKVI